MAPEQSRENNNLNNKLHEATQDDQKSNSPVSHEGAKFLPKPPPGPGPKPRFMPKPPPAGLTPLLPPGPVSSRSPSKPHPISTALPSKFEPTPPPAHKPKPPATPPPANVEYVQGRQKSSPQQEIDLISQGNFEKNPWQSNSYAEMLGNGPLGNSVPAANLLNIGESKSSRGGFFSSANNVPPSGIDVDGLGHPDNDFSDFSDDDFDNSNNTEDLNQRQNSSRSRSFD
ncbi:MAG: hypothetical protein K0Q74_88 [Gammaproteobacteria bacterium]|jgi:hypothetical protein|nr:hypothetical protein [Gammaproteobacteria bacterium]